MNGEFFSGTSGLVLPIPKALYPEAFKDKSRLTYYSSLFKSIEINSSFYKLPMHATVKKWSESVEENFKFTFKLSKVVTHAKALDFNVEDVEDFMNAANNVGENKGCLLIQFPPSLKFDCFEHVEYLLSSITKYNPQNNWHVAIEFRNDTWYNKRVAELLNQFNATMVLHDLPASATPELNLASSFKYLRFHGPGGKYRGSYLDEFLLLQADKIRTWLRNGIHVYCYFNNTMGDAVNNLIKLNQLVSR